jgi:hypothetical protein
MASTQRQRPSTPQTPSVCSISSFAKLIDVSRWTIEREVRAGPLHTLHIRGRRVIAYDEARAYLHRLSRERGHSC